MEASEHENTFCITVALMPRRWICSLEAFIDKEHFEEFDKELFLTVIRHITVYADRRLSFEFINGLIIEGAY